MIINELKGVVSGITKKGTKIIIILTQGFINGESHNNPISIDSISFLSEVSIGDLINIVGAISEYSISKNRIAASSYHTTKETELKIDSISFLDIYDELSGDLTRGITTESWNKDLAGKKLLAEKGLVPDIEVED